MSTLLISVNILEEINMLNQAILELQAGINALNNINQILFDNWKDKVADDYRNNVVNPLSVSLTQYINSLNTSDRELVKLLNQMVTEYETFNKRVKSYQFKDYTHKGWPIFGISGEKYEGFNTQFHFIVSPSQFPQISNNMEIAESVAITKHPDLLKIDKIAFTGNTL